LVDAAIEGSSGADAFRKRVDEWLTALKEDGAAFERQWPWLVLLTRDLDVADRLRQEYPLFGQTVVPVDRVPGTLDTARRRALAEVNAAACLSGILAAWRGQLHRIVPDPAKAGKSNYTEHADWAGALRELNPARFEALIERWRVQHKRRRNLWRDLKARGLTV